MLNEKKKKSVSRNAEDNKFEYNKYDGIKTGKRLGREFFARDGITVARELLGKILVHETSVGVVRGIITETESYMGENDKGAHTYGGRRTERTEPMYHQGGTSYVYLIYGMYSCMNIAVMTEGIPQAVLLRRVEPADVESGRRMELLRMRGQRERELRRLKADKSGNPAETLRTAEASQPGEALRAAAPPESEKVPSAIRRHLADGPGKMCIAMEITRKDNDLDMVNSEAFYVTEGIRVEPGQIKAGKRIGIDYAEEAADYLWRFYL